MHLKLLTSSIATARAAITMPAKLLLGALTAITETATASAPAHLHHPPRDTTAQPPAGEHATETGTTPVLLVPGYLSPHATWGTLLKELHSSGFRNVVCLRYNAFAMDIPAIAALLAAEAHRAMRRAGSDRVHLVGYSLGGLAVRYAVQRLGLEDKTLSAITIATAHQGTMLGHLGVGPAVRQLRRNSPLLSALPEIDAS